VALAFENVRLFQRTRELSITDEVTPLYNFRHFHQILDRELKLVDRYESVLSLVFVDLDRFKPINDQYGTCGGAACASGFLIRAAVRRLTTAATGHGVRGGPALTDGEARSWPTRDLIEGHTFLQEEGSTCSASPLAPPAIDEAHQELLLRLSDQRCTGTGSPQGGR
jgi:hypothetical protein